jgi:hypothetical protein
MYAGRNLGALCSSASPCGRPAPERGRPATSLAQLLTAIVTLAAMAIAGPANASTVTFMEKVGQDLNRYKVSGAEAATEADAIVVARAHALLACGEGLAGTSKSKDAARRFLANPSEATLGLAHSRRITKRLWSDLGPKLDVIVDVDSTALQRIMEDAHVIERSSAVVSAAGNPRIMVIYSGLIDRRTTHAETQLGEVVTDYLMSFFTARRWNVVDRKAVERARRKVQAIEGVSGLPADPVARIAVMAGADIYVSFSVRPNTRGGVQATISVKAFNPTTAQVLASSVANSRQYMAGTAFANVVNEALGNAMPKVFENLMGYWRQHSELGRPVLVTVRADFADRQRYRAARDVLKSIGKFTKSVKTEKQLSGSILLKGDSDDLSDDLEDGLAAAGFLNLRFIVESRSFLMIEEPPPELPEIDPSGHPVAN